MTFYFSPATAPPVLYPAASAGLWNEQPSIAIEIPPLVAPDAPPLDDPSYAPFSLSGTTITVANGANGAWDFASCTDDAPFREAFAQAFANFLVAVEPYVTSNPGGVPIAAPASPVVTANLLAFVQQLVAAAVPLTFAETLYFRHGYLFLGQFFATPFLTTYVDLQPGMRLRIESEIYQTINPSTGTALNGFVPNGTSYVEIGTYANAPAQLGLNPFLTGAALAQPAASGIASTVDISGQAVSQLPYLRLCYPALGLPGAGSQGWSGTQRNATLLGTLTRAALESQTEAYVANGSVLSGVANFFNGRTVVTPEITVFVAGQPQWVPLGTTVRNVLERVTPMPYFGSFGGSIGPTALLSRSLPVQPAWSGLSLATVSLSGGDGGYQFYEGDNCDSLDLPLLAGDVLTVPGL